MTERHQGDDLPNGDWLVQSLRLSAFQAESKVEGEPMQWWNTVTASQPENVNYRPQEEQTHLNGAWLNGKLSLNVHPLRIDWNYEAVNTPPQGQTDIPPNLGPIEKATTEFNSALETWLERSEALARLAFGAILISPADNLVEGNEKLLSLLDSVSFDPVNSRDFFYRINHRKTSETELDQLKINRISNWSVMQITRFIGQSSPELQKPQTMQPIGDTRYTARLELDINTDPEYSNPLPKNILVSLFRELANEGIKIAKEGEN